MTAINDVPLDRPIRVVLFGGGPTLEPGVRRFICRLAGEPEVEFLAAFCQSVSRSPLSVAGDLWRRRGPLAAPLLLARWAGTAGRFLSGPRSSIEVNRRLARVSGRIHFVPDIHAPAVLSRVRALAPDLGLIYGSPILRPELFEIPRFGTLGIHHGKMPQYRGKKTTFWAMANGEREAGVTIQKVNAGLDTGDIVSQGAVAIANRAVRKVWRDVEALGLDLYVRAVLDVKSGTARAQPNPGGAGTLYGDPKIGDLVSWYGARLLGRSRP